MPAPWVHWDTDYDRRRYVPNFYTASADEPFLAQVQADLPAQMADVRGALDRSDHWKLYEAGYHAAGPLLEIGGLAGKSTACIAYGMRDAGHGHILWSVDVNWGQGKHADEFLCALGLRCYVQLVQGDSSNVVPLLPCVFDVVFVDGDHSYTGVTKDILALKNRVLPNGCVMFHDYYHGANDDPSAMGMKVARAVDELASPQGLEFRGGQGAVAIYEQVR